MHTKPGRVTNTSESATHLAWQKLEGLLFRESAILGVLRFRVLFVLLQEETQIHPKNTTKLKFAYVQNDRFSDILDAVPSGVFVLL